MLVVRWDASLPPLLEPEEDAVALSHVLVALHESWNVVACLGAGASTSAGLQDFRSSLGLYSKQNPSTTSPSRSVAFSTPRTPLSSLPSLSRTPSLTISSSPSSTTSSADSISTTLTTPPPTHHSGLSSMTAKPNTKRNIKQLFSYTCLLDVESRKKHFEYMASMRDLSREIILTTQDKNERRRTLGESSHLDCHQATMEETTWSVPSDTPKFVAKMEDHGVTAVHSFLVQLKRMGKLTRVYSQNVDGFEKASGLSLVDLAATSTARDEGETRTNKKQRRSTTTNAAESLEIFMGDCVLLHGSVHSVKCTSCSFVQDWSDKFRAIERGVALACPACESSNDARRSKRHISRRRCTTQTRSFLRPALLLYDEPTTDHLSTSLSRISSIIDQDLSKSIDFLLVVGTSLKIPGFKQLVRRMSERVRENGGLSVLVNLEPVSKEWNDVFDYHVMSDCDSFVNRIRQDWQHAGPTLAADWVTV
ncbi:hypothetical protein ACM66B_006035 [Microbotryomycetes sp. NB124-2]